MAGVLLDTHALYWLVSGEIALTDEALVAIGTAQDEGTLFVSPITVWELALAVKKPKNAPQLGDRTVKEWFRVAIKELSAKIVPIGPQIALEAANMIATTDHKDPGDCYIISTAKMKKVPVVTRDLMIRGISETGYIDVVVC
ncbi:type II toxin-antitoxin system VapC family toxin [Rhizobium miluonense]|uniref:PIN domain nuclease, a component of toxin-antitoxin system (PIN domain) n=1 Tax=Rhizobium miluonense TaxID=411945 RepID=A0A1C3XA47_9HYPH|nr:type II toxin-antitoxin system VapC family toxin [Rhizobium miluonense]SCB49150.1 PIN domain nuclease, a component of toxin-antitoxin system (PIN domain) [Rhizobium miluonense]